MKYFYSITKTKHMDFIFNDGGRANAGFTKTGGDCVVRAIAIATNLPYMEVYARCAQGNATQRTGGDVKSKSYKKLSAEHGISVKRLWFKRYMASLGFEWVPTMEIGSGCKVHLKASELPSGILVVALSKHMTTVINGVIHDIYNPDRGETRCVYGYYRLKIV